MLLSSKLSPTHTVFIIFCYQKIITEITILLFLCLYTIISCIKSSRYSLFIDCPQMAEENRDRCGRPKSQWDESRGFCQRALIIFCWRSDVGDSFCCFGRQDAKYVIDIKLSPTIMMSHHFYCFKKISLVWWKFRNLICDTLSANADWFSSPQSLGDIKVAYKKC